MMMIRGGFLSDAPSERISDRNLGGSDTRLPGGRVRPVLAAIVTLGILFLPLMGCRLAPPEEPATPEGPVTPEEPATPEDDPPTEDPDMHGDTPAAATVIEPGTPHAGRIASPDDVDYFRVAVGDATVQVFAATDRAGTVVRIDEVRENTPDDHVDWGDLPAPRPEHVHVRVSAAAATEYRLAVWTVDAVDPRQGNLFDIDLRYLGTPPTATQQDAIAAAARTWETVIREGLPDLPILDADWTCEPDAPDLFGDYGDDLILFIRVEAMDGRSGAVASASICERRSVEDGGLPFLGSVTFDADDLAPLEQYDMLEPMAAHQMAHVLGFGLLWDEEPWATQRLLREPSLGAPGADTHFAGTRAVAAFEAAGGEAYRDAKVPVENNTIRYGAGALDVHWRESVFKSKASSSFELMTPTLLPTGAKLSAVTIESLADLGYRVNPAAAENYRLPSSARAQEHEGLRCTVSSVPPPRAAEFPANLMRSFNGR